MRRSLLAVSLGFLVIAPAVAQTQPTPDPATLRVARDVITKTQGDRTAIVESMAKPLTAMLQQLGVHEPDRAQILVREVVLPTVTAHYDELLDRQARSFATIMTASDLQAVSAFYDTPAGRDFIKLQPQLAQAVLTSMTQWMSELGPEIRAKVAQAIKEHSW